MTRDNDGDLGKTTGAGLREAAPDEDQPSTKPGSVKQRAKAAAVHVRENLAGTEPLPGRDAADLVGESKIQRPVAEPVNVPPLRYRTLIVRMCTGAVYVAINVLAILWGKFPTAVLMAATAGICCWEFFRLMRADAKSPNQPLGILFAAAMPLISLTNPVYLVAIVFLLFMLLGIWYVVNQRARITDVAITLFGSIYTGMTLSALVAVRSAAVLDNVGCIVLCIGIMMSVWANDSFAYLVGSRFGKHKMVPKISPKKSWEGFAGGIVGSVAIWLLLLFFPQTRVTPLVAVACGVLCGVTGVIGDLVESRIKRGAGVKDSGNMIPGHGGLLDRSDSMLFVAITAYFLLRIMRVIV